MSIINDIGVYRILNLLTGDFYIGSSKSISGRWKIHKRTLELGNHHNLHLQRAWKKYGSKAFSFVVIVLVRCEKNLLKEEQKLIDNEKSVYNILQKAGSPLGYKHSLEALRKIGLASLGRRNTGWRHTAGWKREKSEISKNSKHSEATKLKISLANKGRRMSPEKTRLGAVLSEETKLKISASLKRA